MKNKILCLSATMAFVAFTSCKNYAQSSDSDSTQKEYAGKEIGPEFDKEIDKLISQMTLEEKIGMLHGNSMFSNGGVKRL
ncbi:MAG TPA: hypothetical protein VJ304_12620, partial [Flavobacterium sp.]|nr:hypothetical protein [Flavobacterium sp.]